MGSTDRNGQHIDAGLVAIIFCLCRIRQSSVTVHSILQALAYMAQFRFNADANRMSNLYQFGHFGDVFFVRQRRAVYHDRGKASLDRCDCMFILCTMIQVDRDWHIRFLCQSAYHMAKKLMSQFEE